ncbi:MAG: TPM domain-containing protein [Oscillospiraceae bacterium]
MKNKFTKMISSVLLAIICSISLAMPIFADDERPCIVDDADLLTDSQEENLTAQAKEIIKKHKTDIVIVTTDGMRGKTPEQFADDFYDQNKYGVGANNAGVLVAVDMFNRKVAISCAGEAMEHIDDSRATEIRKSITPNLTSGNFEYAFEMFIDNVDSYYNQPKIKDFKYDAKTDSLVKVRSVSLVQILLFAGISILAGLLACFGVTAKYQ